MFGVQNRMRDAVPLQHLAQDLRFFNGDSAHKHGLALFIEFGYLLKRGIKFLSLGLIDDIRIIYAYHLLICGDDNDFQLIDIMKFRGLRVGRSGHPCQFLVHPEEILKCDGR